MPRRTAKVVSAIFVSVLAGSPFTMMARGETVTAENCLLNPKGETPPGSHWRYRIDHINKRNCWYLRRESGEVAQALPQTSPPAPAPVAKPSFVDARAELRPQAAVRDDAAVANPPGNPTAGVANTAGNGANPANVWNATAAVATRWPESPPPSSAPKMAAATVDPASSATQPAATAPTVASSAASVADLPASMQPEMIPTLIAAAIGAVAFAGAAALIWRRHRGRVRRRKATSARGPIWETTDDDRIVLSDYPAMDDRDFRPRFARGVASATPRHQRAPEFAPRVPRRARR
jgi:hypothetical protein